MTTIVVDPATQATQQTEDVSTETQSQVPEKYRGKSLEDVIEMHRNAETELGRKNNEVGSLRKLTDQVLGLAQNTRFTPDNRQTTSKPELTSEDLLANPQKAVSELARAEADQRVQQTEQRQANLEARLALDTFSRKYPDFENTLQTAEFQGWLHKSDYRQKLAYKAANNDFDAADELLGLYKEAAGSTQTETTRTTQDTNSAAKQAGLVKRGGSSAAGVSATGDAKGKIYSRAELIELRINKPEEYEARYHTEFHKAYQEKRVR